VTGKLIVLLVDDDQNDRFFFASALQETGLRCDLFEANDGYAAIDYLLGKPPYENRPKFPFPHIVFLDLKMPGMDGFEVLKYIRASPELRTLPVIIRTNSNLESDWKTAFALGANSYYAKPTHYSDLVQLLRAIITSWHNRSSDDSAQKPAET
jgi:two-component system, response regulator